MLVIGLTVGSVYSLIALGYSLVYLATGVMNFSQGAFVMVGSMLCASLIRGASTPPALAIVLALGCTVLMGAAVANFVVLPLWFKGAESYLVVLATLIVAQIAENLSLKIWGADPRSFGPLLKGGFTLLGQPVAWQYVFVAGAAVVCTALSVLCLRRTTLGKQMRAAASNREVSSMLGVSPRLVATVAFGAAAFTGGLAGILITPLRYTQYDVGTALALPAFAAAVVGGLGSPIGALVGGIVLGLIETTTNLHLTSRYEFVIVCCLLVLFIAVRPNGLLRDRAVRDV